MLASRATRIAKSFKGEPAGLTRGGTLFSMHELDSDAIRHALKTARENGFGYVKITSGGTKFRAIFDSIEEIHHEDIEENVTSAVFEDKGLTLSFETFVKAPVVGYVSFDDKKAVAGAEISAGDVIGVVKALGLNNDVIAKESGVIEELMVKNGDPVEYGQPIMRVKKS